MIKSGQGVDGGGRDLPGVFWAQIMLLVADTCAFATLLLANVTCACHISIVSWCTSEWEKISNFDLDFQHPSVSIVLLHRRMLTLDKETVPESSIFLNRPPPNRPPHPNIICLIIFHPNRPHLAGATVVTSSGGSPGPRGVLPGSGAPGSGADEAHGRHGRRAAGAAAAAAPAGSQ